MKKSTMNLVMAAICAVCASAWIANCVMDYTARTPGHVDGWNLGLAIVWSGALCLQLYYVYRSRKKR